MFFQKIKYKKEIIDNLKKAEREFALEDGLNRLKAKRREYAILAAEAEMDGDHEGYDIAFDVLNDLNAKIILLTKEKACFDKAVSSDEVCSIIEKGSDIFKFNESGLRKIQKKNKRLNAFLSKIQSGFVSNNENRCEEQLKSLIESARLALNVKDLQPEKRISSPFFSLETKKQGI